MYIRFFFSLLAFTILCFAQTQDVEVLAKNVSKNGDIIHAKGDVVLYSQKYLITADRVEYNQKTGDLNLFGDITVLEGIEYSSKSGRVALNLNSDIGSFDPLFFFEDTTNLWISCQSAISNPEYYLTKKSIVSSCNVQDPDWKIDFTSGKLDRKNHFLSIYNALFYAGDIPIFYLPYFSFSTNKTRRTGFLRPNFGLSSSEGLYYMQPIYFAPSIDWDLELNPQIRTNRGAGINSTFRYVDSPYSKLDIQTGVFSEKSSYAKDNNLINSNHYGFELNYDRSQLFGKTFGESDEDGLYADLTYLNDIDYFNTKKNNEQSYNKLVTSTLNYYFKKDLDYYGLYAKGYIDTAKESNSDTLQELPTLQYHRFSNSLLLDNLLYSTDFKMKNYYRKTGVNATQYEVNVPFTYYFSLLEDYLHFSISENIYLTHVNYSNDSVVYNYGQYYRNYHKFSMYSELSKAYDSFYHTIYMSLDYVVPSKEDKTGYFADFIPVDTEEKSLSLNLAQYFYNSSGDKKVSHTLREHYFFSDYRYKYGDLENNIKIYFSDKVDFSNKIFYSFEFSKFSKIQNSLNYKNDFFNANFMHTYENKPTVDTNFITMSISTKYYRNYDIFASFDYDIKNDFSKSWKIGFRREKKCWDYSVVYSENTTPQLTSSSDKSINKKGIYIMFNLYPLGGIDYTFVKETGESNGN